MKRKKVSKQPARKAATKKKSSKQKGASDSKTLAVPATAKRRGGAERGNVEPDDFIAACLALNETGKAVAKGIRGLIDAIDELTDAMREGNGPVERFAPGSLTHGDDDEKTEDLDDGVSPTAEEPEE